MSKQSITRSGLRALSLILLSVPLAAAPVPEDEQIDTVLRRTTLIVSDVENSLRFYRDALGFTVIYDNMIRTPRDAASDADAERSSRLVFVRANDDYIGIIGLLEYVKPRKPVRAPEPVAFSTGSAVLLFTTTEPARFERALQVPGVEVVGLPEDTMYPGYDGAKPIRVRTSTVRDPDGFLVELNQFLDN